MDTMTCKWCGKNIIYTDTVYVHHDEGGEYNYWCDKPMGTAATPSDTLVCTSCGYHQKASQLLGGKCYSCKGSVI